jgi:hypothetical protein
MNLHGVIAQKTELFITTGVKTSNPSLLLKVFKSVTASY